MKNHMKNDAMLFHSNSFVGPDDTVESPYVQKIRKDISFHDRSQSFATLLPSGSSFESALSTLSDTSLLGKAIVDTYVWGLTLSMKKWD